MVLGEVDWLSDCFTALVSPKESKPIMNIMLFDLKTTGHHATYLHHLLQYGLHNDNQVKIVVTPKFMAQHVNVINAAAQYGRQVEWVPITADEYSWHQANSHSLVKRVWVEWQLFCRYAKQLQIEQALVMYIDHFQLPLALGLAAPCAIAGIYFRPTFHYKQFMGNSLSLSDRLRAWRQETLWRRALHHPQLRVLFSLDPLAVAPLQQLGGAKIVQLPDPIQWCEPSSDRVHTLSNELCLKTQRCKFLLFGTLHERKGIFPLLAAIKQLPADQQQQIALLLVGQIMADNKTKFLMEIKEMTQQLPIQIVVHNEFVAEADVPAYFMLADVVLASYQQHVGSSGILLWAAAAGKPVLASEYGLIGELVRHHHLGVTVDSTQPREIAQGIKAFLTNNPDTLFSRPAAGQFATANSAKHFAQTVWKNLNFC